jgi:uncharacterized protein YggE
MLSEKKFHHAMLIVALFAFAAGCSAVTAAPTTLTGSGRTAVQVATPTDQVSTPEAHADAARQITVTGMGQASGTPDVAHVTVGVETQNASVQQAVAANKTKMAALLDALKALDIADKDIRTSNYSVFTERPPVLGANGNSTTGPVIYHVTNQVNVTIRDISTLGDVLDKAAAAGANNIYGITFSVDDPSKLQSDARAKAIADAKARASSLAQLEGVALGDVVSVNESDSGLGPVFAASAGVGAGGGGAPIQPGELDVTVSVEVTYAIK